MRIEPYSDALNRVLQQIGNPSDPRVLVAAEVACLLNRHTEYDGYLPREELLRLTALRRIMHGHPETLAVKRARAMPLERMHPDLARIKGRPTDWQTLYTLRNRLARELATIDRLSDAQRWQLVRDQLSLIQHRMRAKKVVERRTLYFQQRRAGNRVNWRHFAYAYRQRMAQLAIEYTR